jgi:preprotein translocase subunit SecG
LTAGAVTPPFMTACHWIMLIVFFMFACFAITLCLLYSAKEDDTISPDDLKEITDTKINEEL